MTAICASAPTMFTIAISLAVCARFEPCAGARSRASPLYCRITFAVQNFAVPVCVVLGFVLDPSCLISVNAFTHVLLESDGGGGGRNWSADVRRNGRT